MPLFGERIHPIARDGRALFDNFVISAVRGREPCMKIIVIGNLIFATATFVQIGLSAKLKPSINVAGDSPAQITGQIKIPCKTDKRTLLYGFNFFAIIGESDVARGVICRDVRNGEWMWQFDESKFSQLNSK